MSRTFIIAEAGVNHNGSIELAYQLVDEAKQAGADAVKFQTYKTENLVTKKAQQADYQMENTGEFSSQYEMLKNLELSYEDFKSLKSYCDEKDITFLSTPFDLESVDFLIHDLGIDIIKIPSGEITNAPYLYKIASSGVKIIISTGMATIEEIHHSLAFIAYGLAGETNINSMNAKSFYQTEKAKTLLRDNVKILHCTTEYPAPLNEVNLNAIDALEEEFALEIGLSDHSEGILVPIAAIGKGASVIEKHFTLDKTMSGPDHKASLNPCELKEMVSSIRNIEQALGEKKKSPAPSELKNKKVARKSLVTLKPVKKGERFTVENLTVKRPGTGIEPYYYWDYIGRVADRNYEEDEIILK